VARLFDFRRSAKGAIAQCGQSNQGRAQESRDHFSRR
jgi:hypothetical protein